MFLYSAKFLTQVCVEHYDNFDWELFTGFLWCKIVMYCYCIDCKIGNMLFSKLCQYFNVHTYFYFLQSLWYNDSESLLMIFGIVIVCWLLLYQCSAVQNCRSHHMHRVGSKNRGRTISVCIHSYLTLCTGCVNQPISLKEVSA